jgi:serine/threonine protein kinase
MSQESPLPALSTSPIRPIETFWGDRGREVIPGDIFGGPHPDFVVVPIRGPLAGNGNNTIYTSGGHSILKYNVHCVGEDGQNGEYPDPIALESEFIKRINQDAPGVAAKLHYTSESVVAPPHGTGKHHTHLPVCPGDTRPSVRFMVVERIRVTVHQLFEKYKSFEMDYVAAFGIQLVRLLRQLHSLGIAHGDIHPGNIGVSYQGELILIDFGLARYPPPDSRPRNDGFWCSAYISAWETENSTRSFRDDMYRMVQMLAILTHGAKYVNVVGEMCSVNNTREDLHHFMDLKFRANFFHTSLRVSRPAGGSRSFDFRVKNYEDVNLLDQLLRLVRAPTSPAKKPDYDAIENVLTDIRRAPKGVDPGDIDFS